MGQIGIIVAMEEEKEAALEVMQNKKEIKIGKEVFIKGSISKKECILVRCGIGKVNSARITQKLIENFKLDCVLNVGVAGAIHDNLDIGDVVISKTNIQHDFDLTSFGHKKGYIPEIGADIFSDSKLVKLAYKVANNRSIGEFNTKIGTIVSGDIFCEEESMKNKIKKNFNADIVDMECAAIAQVCYLEDMPYISIRSISDVPNGKNCATFEENLPFASKRAAKILQEFCLEY